jgi:ubiquinone biosynthesis accessory factor UbiJ
MNTSSPFSFFESLATRFKPPVWVVDETQQRLVLFLNHVLMQEPQAQERLQRQKGRVVTVKLGVFTLDLLVTPAGLLDRASAAAKPDLVLTVPMDSPQSVVQAVMTGNKPPVNIEGDVQLAAEVAWLADNLRWDVEEDLSRIIGDAPAHAVAGAARRLFSALKQFAAKTPFGGAPGASVVVASAPTVPSKPAA